MAGKPVRASMAEISDLVSPPDANLRGTVFGGKILQMVDKAAAVCAMRHSAKPCVTVAMERVEFLVPIRIGNLVTARARINHAGRSSMEVGVEVYAEDLGTGGRIHTNSCLVTMVAVDARGRPSPVPRVLVETADERERYFQAEARRKRHS